MVTTLMPQMHRWDNSALLWNVKNTSKMVHSYAGHRDVILDFGWRYNVGGMTTTHAVNAHCLLHLLLYSNSVYWLHGVAILGFTETLYTLNISIWNFTIAFSKLVGESTSNCTIRSLYQI